MKKKESTTKKKLPMQSGYRKHLVQRGIFSLHFSSVGMFLTSAVPSTDDRPGDLDISAINAFNESGRSCKPKMALCPAHRGRRSDRARRLCRISEGFLTSPPLHG